MPDCEIFRNHSVLEEVITVWKKNEIQGVHLNILCMHILISVHFGLLKLYLKVHKKEYSDIEYCKSRQI